MNETPSRETPSSCTTAAKRRQPKRLSERRRQRKHLLGYRNCSEQQQSRAWETVDAHNDRGNAVGKRTEFSELPSKLCDRVKQKDKRRECGLSIHWAPSVRVWKIITKSQGGVRGPHKRQAPSSFVSRSFRPRPVEAVARGSPGRIQLLWTQRSRHEDRGHVQCMFVARSGKCLVQASHRREGSP